MFEKLLVITMAHLFGDYFLQTDYLAGNKGNDNYILLVHCFLYGLGVYGVCLLFGYELTIFKLSTIIGVHIPVDYIKARGVTPKILGNKGALILDQLIHYVTLWIALI